MMTPIDVLMLHNSIWNAFPNEAEEEMPEISCLLKEHEGGRVRGLKCPA
jgi:hypothetical protein